MISRCRLPRVLGTAAALALAVVAGCSGDSGRPPSPTDDTATTSGPTGEPGEPGESGDPDEAMRLLLNTGTATSAGRAGRADTAAIPLALRERSGGDFGQGRLTFHTASAAPVEQYVQVEYPAGSASRSAARDHETNDVGAQSYWPLVDGPLEDAYLRYQVWFPDDFNFVKGGKLPGLYGGHATSGGHIPDGSDGFSTRYMWRENGAAEVYAYLPTSSEHGTSLGRGAWSWPTGRWACIEQRVTLNAPGESNGSVQVWLDERPVLDQGGLRFRDTDRLRIDGLFFSTFFGGGDESWATPTDQIVRFGGFAISTQRLGCAAHSSTGK